ncbi:MAG TPA: rod shape-determining protein MreC [Candidatus Moranbacteria bacterium]|nr:rod shape-determining protein MreC [Candidatus Moranbacteria bacterium]
MATISVCAFFVFLNPKGLFNPVRGFFWTVAYPFSKVSYILGEKMGETGDFLKSISDLKRENERLFKENINLVSEISKLKEEEKENEKLREQLGLIPKEKYALESSLVIGQDPQKLGSWIMIDKGSFQGIAADMPVIVSDGILIGKIEEVYLHSAKVALLTASSSSINALDVETSAKGIIRGEYGLGIILDMVAQNDALNKGDTVVTSGLGSNVPKGLYIGAVEEIKSSPDRLFQQALVIPRVKYSKLDMVFVIKNTK